LLEQALVNLLSNAARYGGDDPTVQIRAAGQGSDDMVRIEVVDRGPGIPVEHQERLFERFYRVDRSRSREVGGTGLGLAIVKHIAVLHQGRVGVRSSEGEGSTFWIELPGAGDVENCSAAEQSASAD
ncbi:MAG: PAS domain-containing sensor histidine kinase, partial [Candidatus Dadabacteria bacterium]